MDLKPEDEKRIKAISEYIQSKEIIEACERNKCYDVGVAVYIKNTKDNTYVPDPYSDYSERKFSKIKYVIVKNDNGFLFGKRVGQSGLGQAIECLTTTYYKNRWLLEEDPEYADAFLLDEKYDPLAQAKERKLNKSKCTSYNKKIRLSFAELEKCHEWFTSLKVGDRFWTSCYAYGGKVAEYTVKNIITQKVNNNNIHNWSVNPDSVHHQIGAKDVTILEITHAGVPNYWFGTTSSNNKCTYFDLYRKAYLYSKKPMSPSDFNE